MENEFSKKIRDAYESDISIHEFMNDISKYFKELGDEEKTKNAQNQERTDYIEKIMDDFDRHYVNDQLTFNDVAAIAVSAAMRQYPNWTKTDCIDFYETVSRSIKDTARCIGMDPKDIMNDIFNSLLQDLMGETHKQTEKAKATVASKARAKSNKMSFEDWIRSL